MRAVVLAFLVVLVGCAVSQPAGAPPAPTTADLRIDGVDWEWMETVTPVETIRVPHPLRYTLRIDGARAALRADCNRASAVVTVIPPRELAFKPLAMTRAMCEAGSLSDRYVRDLSRATTYFFKDDALYLELPADSGTLRFRRAGER